MQKEREEKIIKQLFKEILNYYKKLMQNTNENAELPCQDNMVEDVQVCFRVMCQIVDSFLQGYNKIKFCKYIMILRININYWKINQYQKKLKQENTFKFNNNQKYMLKIYKTHVKRCKNNQRNLIHKQYIEMINIMEAIIKRDSQNEEINQDIQLREIDDRYRRISIYYLINFLYILKYNYFYLQCTTQDRLSTILSQQKQQVQPKTMINMSKKKTSQNLKNSISILGQTITMDRMHELTNLYNNKKTKQKNGIKTRSNTIHITEQMNKPQKQKRVQSIHDV